MINVSQRQKKKVRRMNRIKNRVYVCFTKNKQRRGKEEKEEEEEEKKKKRK
jgi:hypothetical protein